MWYRWKDKCLTLDEVKRLDVRWLHRQGYLDRRPHLVAWSWGEQPDGSVGLALVDGRLVITYCFHRRETETWQDIRQVVDLDWTPCQYGGQRPWFRCPGCQRRVAVLCGYDRLFLCRHCYQLPYTSQYETRLDRLTRKMHKLHDRLGGHSTQKPKGMHWRTWERLQDEAIEAEMTRDCAMDVTFERLLRRG